jgi:hypothetical protein
MQVAQAGWQPESLAPVCSNLSPSAPSPILCLGASCPEASSWNENADDRLVGSSLSPQDASVGSFLTVHNSVNLNMHGWSHVSSSLLWTPSVVELAMMRLSELCLYCSFWLLSALSFSSHKFPASIQARSVSNRLPECPDS